MKRTPKKQEVASVLGFDEVTDRITEMLNECDASFITKIYNHVADMRWEANIKPVQDGHHWEYVK